MLCCRLSRCVCSLASAGCVCWAKPKHAFFNCQQPEKLFFRFHATLLRHVRASMQCMQPPRIASRSCKRMRKYAACKEWRGLQRCMHAIAGCNMHCFALVIGLRKHALKWCRLISSIHAASMPLRVAQVGLRENCANFFRRVMHVACNFASVHHRKKKTRDVAVAGRWTAMQPSRTDRNQWSSSSSNSA